LNAIKHNKRLMRAASRCIRISSELELACDDKRELQIDKRFEADDFVLFFLGSLATRDFEIQKLW
jgi:hypothetical protein